MRRRQGFTLVELLVAMALIIFIMAILSQAFVSATSTFRILKASGDMAEKLRATTQVMQRDLAADHFEGKKRLSNANFWLNGPPQQGYFQVWQASIRAPSKARDLDGVSSYPSTNHTLAFTIKTRGNQMGDFLSAGGPLVRRGFLRTAGDALPEDFRRLLQLPVGRGRLVPAAVDHPGTNPRQQIRRSPIALTGSAGVPVVHALPPPAFGRAR